MLQHSTKCVLRRQPILCRPSSSIVYRSSRVAILSSNFCPLVNLPILARTRNYASNNPFGTSHENRYEQNEQELVVPHRLQNQFSRVLESILSAVKSNSDVAEIQSDTKNQELQDHLRTLNRVLQEFLTEFSEERYVWSEAHLLRAFLLMRLQRFSEAVPDIEKCERHDVSNMNVRYMKANCFVNMNKLDLALSEYNTCLYVKSDYWSARLERARLYRQMAVQATQSSPAYEENMVHSMHDYQLIIDRYQDPSSNEEREHIKSATMSAVESMTTLTNGSPKDHAFIELAWIYTVQGQYQKAVQCYNGLLEMYQQNKSTTNNTTNQQTRLTHELTCYEGLALIYAQLQKHDRAIQFLNVLLTHYKNEHAKKSGGSGDSESVLLSTVSNLYIKRAISYEAMNRFDLAIADCTMVINHQQQTIQAQGSPTALYAVITRAKCFMQMQNFKAALNDLETVSSGFSALIDPDLASELNQMKQVCRHSMRNN